MPLTWHALVGKNATYSVFNAWPLDGDYSFAVNLRESARFASYDERLQSIVIAEGATTGADVGTYEIGVVAVYADGHIVERMLKLVLHEDQESLLEALSPKLNDKPFIWDDFSDRNKHDGSNHGNSTSDNNSTQEKEKEDEVEFPEFNWNRLPLRAKLTEVEPSSDVALEFSRPIDVQVSLLNVTREGRRLETDEEIEASQGQFVALEDLSPRQVRALWQTLDVTYS